MPDSFDYEHPIRARRKEAHVSILAPIGFVLTFVGPWLFILLDPLAGDPGMLDRYDILLPILGGAVCSLIAICQIIQSDGKLRGITFAGIGAFIGFIWIVCLVHHVLIYGLPPKDQRPLIEIDLVDLQLHAVVQH